MRDTGYATHVNFPHTQQLDERFAAIVITYCADGDHARTQRGEIHRSIRAAARISFGPTVAQDQHWRFARNTGDLARDEFVEDEIAEHANSLAQKCSHHIEQSDQIDGIIGLAQNSRGAAAGQLISSVLKMVKLQNSTAWRDPPNLATSSDNLRAISLLLI